MSLDKESNAKLPLISVVVATFNAINTIESCIESICEQTYPNLELIIIDGASTDGTIDAIKAHASKISYWISEPDEGIYDAWNKALSKARGDWICFLGADDYFWNVDVLRRSVSELITLPPEIKVAYGRINVVDVQGEMIYCAGQPWASVGHRIKALMCIPHPGTLHRASLFGQHGKFDKSFRIAGDYDMLLRELKHGRAHFLSGIVIAGVRLGGVSTDGRNTLLSLKEIRRAQRNQGIVVPPLLWLITLVKVLLRLMLTKVFGHYAERMLAVARKCPGISFKWTETK